MKRLLARKYLWGSSILAQLRALLMLIKGWKVLERKLGKWVGVRQGLLMRYISCRGCACERCRCCRLGFWYRLSLGAHLRLNLFHTHHLFCGHSRSRHIRSGFMLL